MSVFNEARLAFGFVEGYEEDKPLFELLHQKFEKEEREEWIENYGDDVDDNEYKSLPDKMTEVWEDDGVSYSHIGCDGPGMIYTDSFSTYSKGWSIERLDGDLLSEQAVEKGRAAIRHWLKTLGLSDDAYVPHWYLASYWS